MRHTSLFILVSVILAIISVDVKAQGLVYTPFIPRQSSSFDIGGGSSVSGSSRSSSGYSRPSCQTELTRTTAYYVDYNGNYYKDPIRVEYTVWSNGATNLKVTEQWEGNGFGGQWKRLLAAARVESCQPITANGSSAALERSFMYKAMVGTRWYYFDL